MTEYEEDLIHLEQCINDLNSAWTILDIINKVDANPVLRSAAYRMAIIEYAKPFKNSRGITRYKLLLDPPPLSSEENLLHEQLIGLRDQFLAHSDLSIKGPQLHTHSYNGRRYHQISTNTEPGFPDPQSFKALVERVLDGLYARVEAMRATL